MAILPSRDRKYLEERAIAFEEFSGPPKVVIFRGYPIRGSRLNQTEADILVELPGNYPDARTDMFYVLPWLTLLAGGRYPAAADQPYDFGGQRWQRWSRHAEQWRPGIDGIWTTLRRIDAALEVAA